MDREKRHKAVAGTGRPAPTVFFHPDCDRRLRHRTGSADPSRPGPRRRSRARRIATYRRWGVSPRPEDVTYCCRLGGAWILAPGPCALRRNGGTQRWWVPGHPPVLDPSEEIGAVVGAALAAICPPGCRSDVSRDRAPAPEFPVATHVAPTAPPKGSPPPQAASAFGRSSTRMSSPRRRVSTTSSCMRSVMCWMSRPSNNGRAWEPSRTGAT